MTLAACITHAYADAKIVSRNGVSITVTLRSCDKDGYETLSQVGSGVEVVVPSSVIARYRGDVARGQLPAVCLVIQLTSPIKLKNGGEEDGWSPCQVRNGTKASHYVDPESGRISVDFNYGTYP